MITISRKQLEATMVKNHGMTPEQASAIMDKQVESCGLEQDGDKLGGSVIDALAATNKRNQAPLN